MESRLLKNCNALATDPARTDALAILEAGFDLAARRARRDTIHMFEKTGDEILTGPMDANVSDRYFLLTY